MSRAKTKTWRTLLVWLHVISSLGWMGQALALCTLSTVAMRTTDSATRHAAYTMAEHVDHQVLIAMANTSAFTGFALSALTAYGLTRHWWVLTKGLITVVQLYCGVWLLSPALGTAVALSAAGRPSPVETAQVVGTALMASALAFQTWLSVAKPWPRTPWARPGAVPAAGAFALAVALLAPVADYGLSVWTGGPVLLCTPLLLIYYLVRRVRQSRVSSPGSSPRTAAPRPAAAPPAASARPPR